MQLHDLESWSYTLFNGFSLYELIFDFELQTSVVFSSNVFLISQEGEKCFSRQRRKNGLMLKNVGWC